MNGRDEIDRILRLYPSGFDSAVQMTTAEACILFSISGATEVTKESIRKAYRKLALVVHPDKNADNITNATTAFRILTTANEAVEKFGFTEKDQSDDIKQSSYLFNSESSYYTGALVADLRREFCLIAEIDIKHVADTAMKNGDVILACLPTAEQKKWEPLIWLLFPKSFVASNSIGSKKKNAEWFRLLVDLKMLIAITSTLKTKKAKAFNDVMHTFLLSAMQQIGESFPETTLDIDAKTETKQQEECKSFNGFYRAMCEITPPEPLTENIEFNECLDEFARQNFVLLCGAVRATARLRVQYAKNLDNADLNLIFSDLMSVFLGPSQQKSMLGCYEISVEKMEVAELNTRLNGSSVMDAPPGLIGFCNRSP